MLQAKFAENIKTYILCLITFSRKPCHLLDCVEKYDRAWQAAQDDIVWRLYISCWIKRATDEHSEFLILIAFLRQRWLSECASVLRYITLCLLLEMLRHYIEYGSPCWDPCRERQINALDWVQKKSAQFTNHKKDSDWETDQRRTIGGLCALFNACCGERTWKAIRDRLWRSYYLSKVYHIRKIRDRKQRTDIGKYFFVNRTIENWNQLPAAALGTFPCKPKLFRNTVGKSTINGVKWKEKKCSENSLKAKWSEVKWGEV